MIRAFASREFLIFLITGGTAAAVNFASRIFFNHWMSYSDAIIAAYIVGMITAFILAKFFVFKKSRQSLKHSVAFFVLVNVIAVVQTWIISMVMAFYVLPYFGIVDYKREIAHACGITVPVFTSYIGHKYWSFR